MEFGVIEDVLGILGLLLFVLTILNILFQFFVRKKSLKEAILWPNTIDGANEPVDDETIAKRKKRFFIAAVAIFNVFFFYIVYVYVLPY